MRARRRRQAVRFGEVDTADAAGALLAHSMRTADGRIPKGTRLARGHLDGLLAAGHRRVFVATPEEGDVGEDDAAAAIAAALCGPDVRASGAVDGRANVFAARAGLFRVDGARVAGLNRVSPAVALATLADREHVDRGRLVATLKVVPFAVGSDVVGRCQAVGEALSVAPYRPSRVALVQTRLPSVREAVLDKTRRVTEARLARCRASLVREERCDHSAGALAAALGVALGDSPDIVLVAAASAVCDERDVVPLAILANGGEVRRVGMPVDPGNLLVLGRAGKAAVLGLPGCARSPKPGGFDWVLRRLCAGECVTSEDVAAMGVGGLLEETHERASPRAGAARDGRGPAAAALLAAGLSSRMGSNKLLEEWRGKPLLRHSAEALAAAVQDGTLSAAVVVTGRDRERVEALVSDLGLGLVHNEGYAAGMGGSIARGIGALPAGTAAAFVCLGDMPLVSPAILGALAAALSPADGKDIAVACCGGKRGHPVLFGARHFPALQALGGDSGARGVLADNAGAVAEVDVGRAAVVDLDDAAAFGREPADG